MRTRNRRFSLWLSEAEFSHLTRQAMLSGLKKEPYIRKLIMGVTIHPRPPDEYYQLIREINAIGNNINQIAYIANAQRHVSGAQMQLAVKMVGAIMDMVRKFE